MSVAARSVRSRTDVGDSYAEFVMVSKEVSTLESEMLELKEALAEWKGMPGLLHIDDSASVAGTRAGSISITPRLTTSKNAGGMSGHL